jgi:SAM-dependent methyltransferase
VAFLSTRTWQFTYFALQLGQHAWSGKDVLDFGGNIGNILRDPNSTIDQERYWCIDIVKEAIEKGKAAYPKSHWIFYDRYCFFFNPHGVPHLTLPDMKKTFDYIVAYSVFTNTTRTDMLQLVEQLEGLLADNGALAFTFIDPHYFSWPGQYNGDNFRWRLDRECHLERERGGNLILDYPSLTERVRGASWCILVNADDLYIETEEIKAYEPDQQKTCHVFYTEEYMKTLFPQAKILPPVNNEMQHCCVITKS